MALSSKLILSVLRVEGEILAEAVRPFGKLPTKQIWMRAGQDYIESRKTRGYLNAKAERVKARP
jgi:hypothetical protein